MFGILIGNESQRKVKVKVNGKSRSTGNESRWGYLGHFTITK